MSDANLDKCCHTWGPWWLEAIGKKQRRFSKASLLQVSLTEAPAGHLAVKEVRRLGDNHELPLAMDMVDDAQFLSVPSHKLGLSEYWG
ncbi:hypothetical protein IFM46972_05216 [Aspergillus udagawae]|uniref:Uncharacterized protein n=1 Tax=Aspergillus udagawae TaxID=91492 RepID=A0A8H3RTK2_9EURO|nr:hypothetical protein IFM46972_05216 [Aspergillus udagawae]